MNKILKIIRSFLPWRRRHKAPTPEALQIKMHRQWTSYSCTAAVAQMVTHYYGLPLSPRAAIRLTDCRPNGACLPDVAKALKRDFGLHHRSLRGIAGIRRAISQNKPVISNDEISYGESHAILVIGSTPKGLWIADPAIGEIYWRHERRFLAGADEFIAISGPT